MPFIDRASREYFTIPGFGGNLQVQQYNAQHTLVGDPRHFDLEAYVLTNIYQNTIITHSGSNGATLRERVGGDWNFTARLSAPATEFIDLILGHFRKVAIIIHLGDPVLAEGKGLPILSYRATKAILDRLVIISDSQGTDGRTGGIVKADIKLSSDSLLWGYIADVPVSSNLWP